MENASKALLIAAAVLIVILLIAFGMQIFQSAQTGADPDQAANAIQSGISQGQSQIDASVNAILNGK